MKCKPGLSLGHKILSDLTDFMKKNVDTAVKSLMESREETCIALLPSHGKCCTL
jgi:hypothetical protein